MTRSSVSKAAPRPFASTTSKSFFGGWKSLKDDAKWDRIEALLKGLPVDNGKVVRRMNDREIELRGTSAASPFA
jgi:hypothetical protein